MPFPVVSILLRLLLSPSMQAYHSDINHLEEISVFIVVLSGKVLTLVFNESIFFFFNLVKTLMMGSNSLSLRSSSPLRSMPKCKTPSKDAVYVMESVREIEAAKEEFYKIKRESLMTSASCHFFYELAFKLTLDNSKIKRAQLKGLILMSTASRLHSTRYLTFKALQKLAGGVLTDRPLQYRLYALRNDGFITIEGQNGNKIERGSYKFFIIHRSGMNIIRIFEDYLVQLNKEYDFNPFL